MLSPEVVSAFEVFQRGVPFVGDDHASRCANPCASDGSLDAFVMEYQTFAQRSDAEIGL